MGDKKILGLALLPGEKEHLKTKQLSPIIPGLTTLQKCNFSDRFTTR